MPGGRPLFEITDKVVEKVESMATDGLNNKEIATVLGISYKTLNKKRKEFSDFSDAIEGGRAKRVSLIKKKYFA
jgi:FixJ family two-component response regulator